MILVTELQLGLKDQTLIAIDELGNYKSIARVEIDNLPGAICGFYYGYGGIAAHIKGPIEMARKVAEEARQVASVLYADREPMNIIIKEN